MKAATERIQSSPRQFQFQAAMSSTTRVGPTHRGRGDRRAQSLGPRLPHATSFEGSFRRAVRGRPRVRAVRVRLAPVVNERVNQAFNDEYETNLANFTRDVREDLGVKDLTFVSAESGMSGPAGKHTRALASMKSRAVEEYEEFKLTVAFVGTKAFWPDKDVSPSSQGFRWNANADMHYLIGDAMGGAMTRLCATRP